jgi:hypothetical protein
MLQKICQESQALSRLGLLPVCWNLPQMLQVARLSGLSQKQNREQTQLQLLRAFVTFPI